MRFLPYLLSFLAVVTINAASNPTAFGTKVVAETNGTHYVTATGATTARTIQARLGDYFSIKDFLVSGETTYDAALTRALAAMDAGDALRFEGPEVYTFMGTNITKDVSMIGVNRPTLRRHASGTTNIFNFTVPQTGLYKGLIVDGNKANVSTNTWTLLSSWYWNSDGATIEDVVFTNSLYRAVLDFQSIGDTTLRDVKVLNNYAVPTNFQSHSFAFAFAPGQADRHVNLNVFNVTIENEEWDVADGTTQPAGFLLAGSDSVNNSTISLYVHGLHGLNVGGDHIIGSSHYGGPFLDVYGPGIYRVHGDDLSVTGNKYIPFKLQNAKHVKLSKLYAETDSLVGVDIAPGERAQTNAYQDHILRDVTIIGDPSRTVGFLIRSGYSGGFTNVTIDRFKGESLLRIGQIDGIDDAGDVVHPGGPILLNDIHAEGGSGIVFIGYSGDATIQNSYLRTTNGNTISAAAGTNYNANIRLINNRIESTLGGNITAFGVKNLIASGNIIVADSGKAVWLADDPNTGENIQKLHWDRNNQIVSGTVDITTADIDAGYFWNGATATYYPAGWTMTLGNGSSTYGQDLSVAASAMVLPLKIQNPTAGGAANLGLASDTATGGLNIYSSTYADADKADRIGLKGESNVSGVDVDAAAGNVRIRARDGSTGTIEFQSGGTTTVGRFNTAGNLEARDVSVTDEAFGSSWNGSTNVPTKNAIYDRFNNATTNVATFALGDMTTAITAGAAKSYWVAPYDGTLVSVKGSVFTASSSGAVTFDIELAGATVMSVSKITIDESETTSQTAATQPALTTVNFSAGQRFTFDIDGAGTNAAGPQVSLCWIRR